jgi:hypothetical protein
LSDHLSKETIRLFKGERSIPDQPVQDTQSTSDRETGSSGEATRPEVIRQHESVSSFSDRNARRLTRTNLADQYLRSGLLRGGKLDRGQPTPVDNRKALTFPSTQFPEHRWRDRDLDIRKGRP